MQKIKQEYKKGAASFYIVAFSTLILLIVATSFAAVIISEVERTSNDDLSQSAYDSALAGLEDAKLAYYSYQNCVAQDNEGGAGMSSQCKEIVKQIEEPNCDMTGRILGKMGMDQGGEVLVKEGDNNNNNMEQYYTCVRINTVLDRYDSVVSSSAQTKAVKVKLDKVPAKNVGKVKISWYSDQDRSNYAYTNFLGSEVKFPALGLTSGTATTAAMPPTISVALVQTAKPFTLEQLSSSVGNTTDKGMIYLVPTSEAKSGGSSANYKGATWSDSERVNKIGADAFIKSNDKSSTNLPYTVKCPKDGETTEFACSAMIDLPDPVPVGSARNDDTFMIVVSLPYGKPTTNFSLEFYCKDSIAAADCDTKTTEDENGNAQTIATKQVNMKGMQIEIDSTGRANDLYRRIDTKLEAASSDGYLSIMGPLELVKTDDDASASSASSFNKEFTVKCEYTPEFLQGFEAPAC